MTELELPAWIRPVAVRWFAECVNCDRLATDGDEARIRKVAGEHAADHKVVVTKETRQNWLREALWHA